MFPDDHNQVRGVEIFNEFQSIQAAADPDIKPSNATSKLCTLEEASEDCYFHWCEATDTHIEDVGPHCICSRITEGICFKGQGKGAVVRIAGINDGMRNELESILMDHVSGSQSWSIKDLGSLVSQNWATGKTEVLPFVEAREQTPADGDCYLKEHCYCGVQQCNHDGSNATTVVLVLQSTGSDGKNQRRLRNSPSEGAETQEISDILGQVVLRSLSGARAQQSPDFWKHDLHGLPLGRQLSHKKKDVDASMSTSTSTSTSTPPVERRVPLDQRAEVVAIFGIAPQGSQPLLGEYDGQSWVFLSNFDPADPWAQRGMYDFCMNTPRDLLVASSACWISDFQVWLVAQQPSLRFPLKSQAFTAKLLEFSQIGRVGVNKAKDFMWIRNGHLKGAYFKFQLDYSKTADAEKTLKLKRKWDAHVQGFNQENSDSIRGIWHTSTLWVRAEAESEILGSTLSVVILAVVLAFLSMLIFTQDIVLSVYVIISTVGVIFCLAFFIIVVMGWALGAIEVIALIVFIGYAVTYSLHIAHKYGSHDFSAAKAEKPRSAQIQFWGAQGKEEDDTEGKVEKKEEQEEENKQENGQKVQETGEDKSQTRRRRDRGKGNKVTEANEEKSHEPEEMLQEKEREKDLFLDESGSSGLQSLQVVSSSNVAFLSHGICLDLRGSEMPHETPEKTPETLEKLVQDPSGPPGQLYQGQVLAGMKHGTGVLHFEIAEIEGMVLYQGQFRRNKKDGHGGMQWPDGHRYVGQFENDEFHGKGTMYWPDGQMYNVLENKNHTKSKSKLNQKLNQVDRQVHIFIVLQWALEQSHKTKGRNIRKPVKIIQC